MKKRKSGESIKHWWSKMDSIYFKSPFIGLIIMSLVSCATYVKPKRVQNIKVITPNIDVEATASLGQAIINSGYGHRAKVLRVNSTISKKDITGGSLFVTKGLYELIHSDGEFEYYNPINSNQIYFQNVYGNVVGSYVCQIRLSSSYEISVIDKSGFKMKGNFTDDLDYTLNESMFIEQDDSFQQTLIYLGKENNILKFSYREFSDNRIRDSFTTEISYDLSESKIIGFKDFKAEIIEASNTLLKYRIISSF